MLPLKMLWDMTRWTELRTGLAYRGGTRAATVKGRRSVWSRWWAISIACLVFQGCVLFRDYQVSDGRIAEAILHGDTQWLTRAFTLGLSPDRVVRFDGVDRPILHWAVVMGSRELVACCLDAGADRLLRDSRGLLAVEYALMRPSQEIAGMLERTPTTFPSQDAFVRHSIDQIMAKCSVQLPPERVHVVWSGYDYAGAGEPLVFTNDVAVTATNGRTREAEVLVVPACTPEVFSFTLTLLDGGRPAHRNEGCISLCYGYWLVAITNAWDF